MRIKHPIFLIALVLIETVSFGQTSRGFKDPSTRLQQDLGFTPYGKKLGLVVGIDAYSNGVPALNYAVADARAIERLLIDDLGFDDVTILEDDQADRRGILRAINTMSQKAQPEDQVFFYFAGHGISFGEGNTEMGYLVPSDVQGFGQEDVTIDGLSMSDIRERVTKLPAKHVLVAVDACYGGYAAATTRSLPASTQNYLKVITTSRARHILTAGKRDEVVMESSDWGHSAFTYKLLDGLKKRLADSDDNGVVTAAELYTYLSSSVNKLTGGQQTPQFANFNRYEGEFVFVLPDQKATPTPEPVKTEPEVRTKVVTEYKDRLVVTNKSTSEKLFANDADFKKNFENIVLDDVFWQIYDFASSVYPLPYPKISERKAIKFARLEAKDLINQGYYSAKTDPPLENQINNMYKVTLTSDEYGYPKSHVTSGTGLHPNLFTAQKISFFMAMLEMVTKIGDELGTKINSTLQVDDGVSTNSYQSSNGLIEIKNQTAGNDYAAKPDNFSLRLLPKMYEYIISLHPHVKLGFRVNRSDNEHLVRITCDREKAKAVLEAILEE